MDVPSLGNAYQTLDAETRAGAGAEARAARVARVAVVEVVAAFRVD